MSVTRHTPAMARYCSPGAQVRSHLSPTTTHAALLLDYHRVMRLDEQRRSTLGILVVLVVSGHSMLFCRGLTANQACRIRSVQQHRKIIIFLPNNHWNHPAFNRRAMLLSSESSSRAAAAVSSGADQIDEFPRGAVSVCVRCTVVPLDNYAHTSSFGPGHKNLFLLVQRGRPPNQGQWSLPGGKLGWGETALQGAIRELREETVWQNQDNDWNKLRWYPGTVCTTDAIGPGYHYLLAHCFAEMTISMDSNDDYFDEMRNVLPKLGAADDAAAVQWWEWHEIQEGIARGEVTPSVDKVVYRVQELSECGMLPTKYLRHMKIDRKTGR